MSALLQQPRDLILYGTMACHLCEHAERLLHPWVTEGWRVELIDIAESDVLLEQLSLVIPVLECVATRARLHWPFDAQQLHKFLSNSPDISAAVI